MHQHGLQHGIKHRQLGSKILGWNRPMLLILDSAMRSTTEARWTQRLSHLQKEYLEFSVHLEGESFSDPKIVTSP
jgi:hypothetical protein